MPDKAPERKAVSNSPCVNGWILVLHSSYPIQYIAEKGTSRQSVGVSPLQSEYTPSFITMATMPSKTSNNK